MLDANNFSSTVPRFFGQPAGGLDHPKMFDSNYANPKVLSPARNSPAQEESYEACPHCSRTFFAGRLKLHLKNCKNNKPQQKAVKSKSAAEKSEEENNLTSYVATVESQTYQSKMNSHYRNASIQGQEVASGHKPEYAIATEDSFNDDANIQENKDRTKAEDGRVGCFSCGRFFYEDRVAKHEKACKKSSKKRPVFDATQQRAIIEQGGPVKKHSSEPIKAKKVIVQKEKAPDLPKKDAPGRKEEFSKKVSSWKAQHENFIENIRFNRKLKQKEARGEDTNNLVVPTIVNDTYISCNYCFRKFAPATAERHIPKCKTTFNRPKPPKHLQLEKLEDLERSKSQISPKKLGASIRKSPDIEVKEPVSPAKSLIKEKNGSYRATNFEIEPDERSQENCSPKGNAKLPQFTNPRMEPNLSAKKLPGLENSKKVTVLPDIRRQDLGENSIIGYDLNISGKKSRELRSQSPPGAKKVFTEPMPKKENLLQHYQSLFIRASQYAAVECPYCQRKFANSAAERHIPVCKSLGSRNMKKKVDEEVINLTEKKRPKMYYTGFDMKLEVIESTHPRSSHNGSHSTGYDHFFSGKRNKKADRRLNPLPLRKPENDLIKERSPIPQQPKFFVSMSHFCTSCGSKLAKAHNFCGNCGHKKDEL